MGERSHGLLWVLCISGAGLAGAIWYSVSNQIYADENKSDLFSQACVFAFITLCILAILVSVPDLVSHFMEHRHYWRSLAAIPREQPTRAQQETIHQTPQHRYSLEWRDYWLKALEYAGDVGGVSFSRMREFFAGDHATWRECFAIPMVRAGYVNPVQPKVETTCTEGWSIEKVKWAVESGHSRLTPLPYLPPSPFEQNKQAEQAKTSDESVVFASTTRK